MKALILIGVLLLTGCVTEADRLYFAEEEARLNGEPDDIDRQFEEIAAQPDPKPVKRVPAKAKKKAVKAE